MDRQLHNKSSLKQKFFLIFLGLLISIILAEVFFRISGVIANKKMIQSVHVNTNTNSKILCIGDSSTYGLEASNPDKYSYPAQLQALLDEKVHNKKFDVINLGIPGVNSSQVLHRFRENLLKYKPDIAIVMIGINDPWNLEENNILQGYDEKNILRKGFLAFESLLNKSRVFQFFKLIYISGEFKDMKREPEQISSQEQNLNIPAFNEKTRNQGFQYSQYKLDRAGVLYNSIATNIIKLKQIAEEQHVLIIFMKYHNVGWGGPDKIINETYANLNVPVVDQFSVFEKAKALGLNVRGNDGWHPNDFGYLLMARNIFNKMVDLKIIDNESVEIFPLNLSDIKDSDQVIGDGIGFYDWETWGGGEIPEWPDSAPVKFRWTQAQASISVNDMSDKGIALFLFASNPDIRQNPLRVKITGDNGFIREVTFTGMKWTNVVLRKDAIKDSKIITLQTDRTWSPKAFGLSGDDRELGVALALPSAE